MSFSVTIENRPDYAEDYEFIVARLVDNKLWFYGAWNDRNEANRVAETLGDNAIVITNDVKIDKGDIAV